MTDREERQALFWIKRWKMIGGGFNVTLAEQDGIKVLAVNIVRQIPAGNVDAIIERTATALAQELTKDKHKHLHVGELVRNAWIRANPGEATVEAVVSIPAPANDEGPPRPAA